VGHDGVIVEGNEHNSSSDERSGSGVQRADPVHPWAIPAFLVCGALAFAWIAAATTPFSVQADIVTAVPLGIALVLATWSVRKRRRRPPDRSAVERNGHLWPWAALVVAVATLELVAYILGLGAARDAYPTISSLYDQVSNVRAAKAILFFSWLALGWALVRP
jgi:hypothetical protein